MQPWAEWFYKGRAWLEVRASYLASVGGLCERCLAHGEVVAADVVHHKEYLNEENIRDPAVSLNFANLEALCLPCHNREHFRDEATAVTYRIGPDGKLVEVPPMPGDG